jgi:hypothetical protein
MKAPSSWEQNFLMYRLRIPDLQNLKCSEMQSFLSTSMISEVENFIPDLMWQVGVKIQAYHIKLLLGYVYMCIQNINEFHISISITSPRYLVCTYKFPKSEKKKPKLKDFWSQVFWIRLSILNLQYKTITISCELNQHLFFIKEDNDLKIFAVNIQHKWSKQCFVQQTNT